MILSSAATKSTYKVSTREMSKPLKQANVNWRVQASSQKDNHYMPCRGQNGKGSFFWGLRSGVSFIKCCLHVCLFVCVFVSMNFWLWENEECKNLRHHHHHHHFSLSNDCSLQPWNKRPAAYSTLPSHAFSALMASASENPRFTS